MKTKNFQKLLNLRDNPDSIVSDAAGKKYSYLVLTKPEYFQSLDKASPVFFNNLGEEAKRLDLPEVWDRFFAIADWAIKIKHPYLSNLAETLVGLCEAAETEDFANFDYGDCSYSENGSLQARTYERLMLITIHIDINLMRRLMTLASEDVMFFEVVSRRLSLLKNADLSECSIFPDGFASVYSEDYMAILSHLAGFSNANKETFLIERLLEMIDFLGMQDEVIKIAKKHFANFNFERPLHKDELLPLLKMVSKITALKGQQSYPLWGALLDNSPGNNPFIFEAQVPHFSKLSLDSQMIFLRRYSQRSFGLKLSELCFDILKRKETSENYAIFLLDILKSKLFESQIPFWERIVFLSKHGQEHPELAEECMKVIEDQFTKLDYKNANLLDFLFLSLQSSDDSMFRLLYSKIDFKKLRPKADNFKTAFADMALDGIDIFKKQRFDEVVTEILTDCLFDNYQEALKVTELLQQYEISAEVQLTAEAKEQKELIELIESF